MVWGTLHLSASTSSPKKLEKRYLPLKLFFHSTSNNHSLGSSHLQSRSRCWCYISEHENAYLREFYNSGGGTNNKQESKLACHVIPGKVSAMIKNSRIWALRAGGGVLSEGLV